MIWLKGHPYMMSIAIFNIFFSPLTRAFKCFGTLIFVTKSLIPHPASFIDDPYDGRNYFNIILKSYLNMFLLICKVFLQRVAFGGASPISARCVTSSDL